MYPALMTEVKVVKTGERVCDGLVSETKGTTADKCYETENQIDKYGTGVGDL